MATIDKKLIHFNRLADFEARLAAGDIRDYSIVCIKDAKLIWTHGEYYGDLSECLKVTQQTLTDEEKRQVQENLGHYFLEWDGESETIQLSDEEYEKLKNATEVLLRYGGEQTIYPAVVVDDFFLLYSFIIYGIHNSVEVSIYENPIRMVIQQTSIPTTTSQLENNSDFVSAVDTGTEVDGVDVTYVTEAAMNAALSGKQDKLVSGTNIKTINGESILGEGNIVIEGGSGGSSSGSSGAYAEVNHGTSDTIFTLTPNTFHVWDEVTSLDLSFGEETSGVANEYLFQFSSGATATTLTLPSDIKWANDTAPTINANMIYQISVLKGLASVLEFSHEVSVFPATLVNGANGDLGVSVYNKLNEIAQGGSGTLPSGDLTFSLNGNDIPVTSFFYNEAMYPGYVIYDTGMEYYILQVTGDVVYFFYD